MCCILLLVSFGLFLRDQAAGASAHQNQLASATAVAPIDSIANRQHGQPRRFIDSAADSLRAPFDSIVHSSSPWVDRGLPTLFGLVVYGLGMGFVARFASGRP